MKISVLIFWGIFYTISAFVFEDPSQDGVTWGATTPTVQIVNVEENNDGDRVIFAHVTEVVGELTIQVNVAALRDILNVQKNMIDSTQYDLTANLVDYEALREAGLVTSISIGVTDDTGLIGQQTLVMNIQNLDDEKPTLSVSSCEMKEEEWIGVDTSTCIFQVSDRDGWLRLMDFSAISGTKGEEDLFELKYLTSPADDVYQAEVYLVLQAAKKLDYETTTLYTFRLDAKDASNHATDPLASIPIIVEVKDIPDQYPRWSKPFISAVSIKEEEIFTTTVEAIDGDLGINNNISYKIDDSSGFVSINGLTGEITVEPIDRDAGHDQVTFTVTAIEVEEPSSTLEGTITLLVEDIDDNIAVLTVVDSGQKLIDIRVDEGVSDLGVEISATDLDMGQNSIYNAYLVVPDSKPNFISAISVIPGKGYETTTLSLTILNPTLLDYENSEWRVITMDLWTKGTNNASMTDFLPITITLNDINDESPIFDKNEYTVSVLETVPGGATVATIKATDKDQEDQDHGVGHVLVGTQALNNFILEPFGGSITTQRDNVFDREKQEEVIVTIRATDLGGHSASAQLTIQVEDVNDESPKLLVSSTMEVAENQKTASVISSQITASDDDGTPYLTFSINWDDSTATKNSRPLADEIFQQYRDCVIVNTIRDQASNNTVTAEFVIQETVPDNTPDFEIFDNLYLQLVVTDLLTEVQGKESDTARVVISITDINDNAPIFPADTESVRRTVVENAAAGTLINSPVATDADIADNLSYSIQSTDSNTSNWLTIDSKTGVITVNVDVEIDCDTPPRESLVYDVTVTDGVHETSVTITVEIIDQNDKIPTMEAKSVSITETVNGDDSINGNTVVVLDPIDLDRSEPFHTVHCLLAVGTGTEVSSRFSITDDSSEIIVNLSPGVNLDREETAEYTFSLNCYDDPDKQGPVSNPINPPPQITITLIDINDNAPTIKDTSMTGTLTENTAKGFTITLEGEDLDDGDNARIEFLEIREIIRYKDDQSTTPEEGTPQDLFTIATADNDQQGILTLNAENLRNYYGILELTISLTDLGSPPLLNNQTVRFSVGKYNFLQPTFSFPNADTTVQYLYTTQTPNSQLMLFDKTTPLSNIKASDNQGDKFGVKFNLLDDGGADLFTIVNVGNSEAQLQMKSATFTKTKYTLTISAYNDAPENTPGSGFTRNATLDIDFFDENTDPIFENHEGTASFEENQKGLTYQVEAASYSKTELPDDLPIYYLLATGDSSIFNLNSTTGLLTLLKELDYESLNTYHLIIQSSNAPSLHTDAGSDTKYNLTVEVIDVNDNPPVFRSKSYIEVLVVFNSAGTNVQVTQVAADDLDTTSQGKLRYSITNSSGSTSTLNQFQNPFEIDTNNGNITQNFRSTSDMTGYFTLEVTVYDESDADDHKDTAEVKIFLVGDQSLVQFTFENNKEDVVNKTDDMKRVLDEVFVAYNYSAKVSDSSEGSSTDTNTTVSSVYFINLITQAPVDKTEIYRRVTDVNFFQTLKAAFLGIGLALQNFDATVTTSANLEETLKAWLIGVSVVLGSLCLILLIAFILKTRALNQRINKLSNTKFGSQESGLNRTGVAAPTTNKHAIEGSNPVYNNEVDTKDIDRRISVTSGDSDLIGVEDDEKFGYDLPTKEHIIE